ncbi:MAG: FAD-binding protein, partial [Bacteroidota bacterium]
MTSSPQLDAKIPDGTLEQKWTKYRSTVPLVNPANKRNLEIIIVGSGLAGASAAASLADLVDKVKVVCVVDSARRAQCIAAQGGIMAAKISLTAG